MSTPEKKKPRTPSQIATDGVAALIKNLGLGDAMRFIQLYHRGRGNYARDRHKWLDKLSREEVYKLLDQEVKKRKRNAKKTASASAGEDYTRDRHQWLDGIGVDETSRLVADASKKGRPGRKRRQ